LRSPLCGNTKSRPGPGRPRFADNRLCTPAVRSGNHTRHSHPPNPRPTLARLYVTLTWHPQDALAACEEFDSELADLIKQNERSLREIRSDLEAAKREQQADSGDADAETDGDPMLASQAAIAAALRRAESPVLGGSTALPPRPGTATGNRVLASRYTRCVAA
jgi:hypothetical protein